MIGIGPFFLNTILGVLIALPAAMPVFELGNANILHYLLIYLGVSIAMHAFPSTGDASSIWKIVQEKDTPFLTKIIAVPVVGLIYLGALGSFFWLDFVYGLVMVMGFPHLIIELVA